MQKIYVIEALHLANLRWEVYAHSYYHLIIINYFDEVGKNC